MTLKRLESLKVHKVFSQAYIISNNNLKRGKARNTSLQATVTYDISHEHRSPGNCYNSQVERTQTWKKPSHSSEDRLWPTVLRMACERQRLWGMMTVTLSSLCSLPAEGMNMGSLQQEPSIPSGRPL